MPIDMKKKIAEAALRLLTEKKARKLTVKDIVEECHIYHRYFRSDLLCEDREIYGFRLGGVPDFRNIQHHGRRHAAGISGSWPLGHGAAAAPLVYRPLCVPSVPSEFYPRDGRRNLLLVCPDREYHRYYSGNHDDRPAYAVIVLSGLSDRHVSDSAGRG